MEKERKELKLLSIVILAFAAFSLVRNIVSLCVNGLPQTTEIPEGMTAEAVKVIAIVTCVIGFIVYLPQIYLGIKGWRVADGADGSGKAHKVWAIILAVFAVISVISGLVGFSKGFDFDKLISVLDAAVDAGLFISYFIYARKIA